MPLSYDHWFRKPQRETVREMMERCRRADDERQAAGTQDAYLLRQAICPEPLGHWADKFFDN